jgi:hypothetical protein
MTIAKQPTLPRARSRKLATVLAGAAALALLLGGGYWFYSDRQQRMALQDRNGVYSGQVCYGPSRDDPARCYPAQATVTYGRISGRWPARGAGVSMNLAGTISNAGDVKITILAERADGERVAAINLNGTLRDGRLDAAGCFLTDRAVTIAWQRN